MAMTQAQRAELFRDLHFGTHLLVLPNPWDAGSARLLAGLGFEALATTSAGLAFSLGHRDGVGEVSREQALANAAAIVQASGDTCRTLEDHPFAGRSRDEIRPGLRSALSSPYVIFYRVKDNIPEGVRVLDGRRDVDEIFSDETQQK